jgi:hypothetical protein
MAAAAGLDGNLLVGGDDALACAEQAVVPAAGVQLQHPDCRPQLGGQSLDLGDPDRGDAGWTPRPMPVGQALEPFPGVAACLVALLGLPDGIGVVGAAGDEPWSL